MRWQSMAKYRYTLEYLNDNIRGVSNQVFLLDEKLRYAFWVIAGLIIAIGSIILSKSRG